MKIGYLNGPLIILNGENLNAATKDDLINQVAEIERIIMANPAFDGLSAKLTKLKNTIATIKVGGTALPVGALAPDEVLQVNQMVDGLQTDADAKAGGSNTP